MPLAPGHALLALALPLVLELVALLFLPPAERHASPRAADGTARGTIELHRLTQELMRALAVLAVVVVCWEHRTSLSLSLFRMAPRRRE